MNIQRLLVIVLLPYLVAVLIGWLSPERLLAVTFILSVWIILLSVFLAGLSLGSCLSTLANNKRTQLVAYVAVAMCVLSLLPVMLLFMRFSIAALLLSVAIFFLTLKNCRSAPLWGLTADATKVLVNRYSWIAIGCVMMTALSYLRVLQV